MIIQVQGQDEIIVDVPVEKIWPLISDSKRLLDWGPPVRGIEVIGPPDQPEGLGSYRRVDAEFDGQLGHFIERRIEHIEGKKMAVHIEEENFGVFRMITDVGSSLEIESVGPHKTRVIFSFFHRPKGVLGHIMNRLVILRQQRRNRLAALVSLKQFAEKTISGHNMTQASIPYFGPGLIQFLSELKANNDRAWFNANKQRYISEIEEPMSRFIVDFGKKIIKFNKNLVADTRRVGGSMFRIYRDMRFSKDKTPFKVSAAAQVPHQAHRRDQSVPDFYLHSLARYAKTGVELGLCVGAGGIYHPNAAALKQIRTYIAEIPKAWGRY